MGADEPLPRHADVGLHEEFSARERVDATLNARHLTTQQAVAALNAHFRENQGRFPHVVIATVMVADTPGGERNVGYHSYYGPFADRRESEEWAKQRFANIDDVRWEVARILTAEMDAAEAERMRRALGDH